VRLSNQPIDAVILKALAIKHIAKQHTLHLLLRLASKCLSDRLVSALCWINDEPLGLLYGGNSDADQIFTQDSGYDAKGGVQSGLCYRLK